MRIGGQPKRTDRGLIVPIVTTDGPSADELLDAWREASRAADHAERLAKLASDAAEQSAHSAAAADEVAILAEKVAAAAERAAATARLAAERADVVAARNDEHRMLDADDAEAALQHEAEARERYHDAEHHARE